MSVNCHFVLSLIVAGPTALAAQAPGIAGPRPGPLNVASITVAQDTTHRQAVVYNWQEPALIGGALLGSFTNLVAYGFCVDGESTGSNYCALGGELAFLTGGVVGGGIAGLIGSTSKASTAPPGFERDGDRRLFGALILAVPSLTINGYGFVYECNNPRFLARTGGCNAGNLAFALLAGALNAWIGAQIGKGIPAYRKVD